MEYRNKSLKILNTGTILLSAVLLLSIIPLAENAEGDTTHEFYGWVYDLDSGAPIEDVTVTLFDPDDGSIKKSSTDEDGYYHFNAKTGHYLIQYWESRYFSKTESVVMNNMDKTLGDTQLNEIDGLTDATLTGNIDDDDSNPVRNAYVYLIDETNPDDNLYGQSDSHILKTMTDDNGDYEFDNAYAGNFKLIARLSSDEYYFGGQKDVTLAAGANNEDLTIDDFSNGNKVYVKVFDQEGTVIDENVNIIVHSTDHMWNSTETSPGGVRVTNGAYNLIVRAEGYYTHIESINVNSYTPVNVYLEEEQLSQRETEIRFNDWENVNVETNETRQFHDNGYFTVNEFAIMHTGLIRYDVDNIFGDSDGNIDGSEETNYQNYLNNIKADGDYTPNTFEVDGKNYEITNYNVLVDFNDTDVENNGTITYNYSYDLSSDMDESDIYEVDIQLENEMATVELPDGFEITREQSRASHDENDTTVVFLEGTGNGGFRAEKNKEPTPVIGLSDDFIPNDDIFLYKDGETIEFNATNSYDPSHFGKIVEFEWTFDDGSTVDTETTPVVEKTFTEGTYGVTLEVTDNAGEKAQNNITLIIDGTVPDADFSVEPNMVEQGAVADENTIGYFNITTLNDTNGIFEKFFWDTGDDNNKTINEMDDRNTTHNYLHLNISKLTGENTYTYPVSLTVWDKAGNNNTVIKNIDVNNTRRPVAYFTVSPDLDTDDDMYIFSSGQNITFNATNSYGRDMDVVNYTWDFDDGTGLMYDEVLNHTFAAEKAYDVKLTVKDEVGGITTENKTIYIDDSEPDVSFDIEGEGVWENEGRLFIKQKNNSNAEEDYVLMFNVSEALVADNGPVGPVKGLHNFSWTFENPEITSDKGDITDNVSLISINHFYPHITNMQNNVTIENITYYYYTVTLKVTDKAGNSASFQRDIFVNDTEAPVAKFDYKEEINQDAPMFLNASATTDNIGISAYSWTIQDPDGEFDNRTGTLEEMENITVTFNKTGEHTVTLKTTDMNGNTDTKLSVITVNRVPKPDILVNSDDIFYSKDNINEGDKVSIMANITNDGDLEAFNVTVDFYFRKNMDSEEKFLGTYEFKNPIVMSETRLANITWDNAKTGQIVVKANVPELNEVTGETQIDENPGNNEGFQDIYAPEEESETNWTLIIIVFLIIVIIVGALAVYMFRPDLIGLSTTTSPRLGKGKK